MKKPPALIDGLAFLGKGTSWANPPRQAEYSVTELLERGQAAGIGMHCVMAPRNDQYAEANRAIAALCARHTGRLTGIAVHSAQRESGRLRKLLEDETRSMGLRAVRSDGQPTRELLDAARELRIPVIYYPDRAAGQGPARSLHMPLGAYPDVDFILPHLGEYRSLVWHAHLEAIDLARRYRNLYLDTSGLGSFKYLEIAARELPPEKLLFGTAGPEQDPRVEREALRLLSLPSRAHAKVAAGNAAKIFRIG